MIYRAGNVVKPVCVLSLISSELIVYLRTILNRCNHCTIAKSKASDYLVVDYLLKADDSTSNWQCKRETKTCIAGCNDDCARISGGLQI